MVAAVLPVPYRPEWRRDARSKEADENRCVDTTDLFDMKDIKRFRKGRRWRVTNRIILLVPYLQRFDDSTTLIFGPTICTGDATLSFVTHYISTINFTI
ncbi:MAG: hypothetical protein M1828_007133 [Chrysothrix sp. TS-e1954]|nr:MAG: hypothetical protein M1828_007133 [Chrysothrix sp. TS-e1954]